MGQSIEGIIGAEADPAFVRRQSLFNMRQYAIQQGWKASLGYTSSTLDQADYVETVASMAQALTDEIMEDLVRALSILDVTEEHEAKPS